MQMSGGWEDYLHLSFRGEHVLVQSLQLTSGAHFFAASLLTIFFCLTERLLTFALARQWSPLKSLRFSRVQRSLWRAGLYWVVTLLRLIYMLVAMSYHVGLILMTVTALAAGQFVIEYLDVPTPSPRESSAVTEPLLKSEYPLRTRSRNRSKPDDIFIHPTQSNLARADAAATEMGLSESTHTETMMSPDDTWQTGKGREVARELLGPSSRRDSAKHAFRIADNYSDSD